MRVVMNIKIYKEEKRLVLRYCPENSDEWIDEQFRNGKPIRLKCGVFIFEKIDLLLKKLETMPVVGGQDMAVDRGILEMINQERNHVWTFLLGVHESDGYYHIPGRILSSSHDVLIHETVEVRIDFFTAAVFNTQIVPIIDKMIGTDLVIGGDAENAIPLGEYQGIIKRLPNREELHRYAQSRIEGVLSEYVPDTRNSSMELQEYVNRKYRRIRRCLDRRGSADYDVATCVRELDCTRMTFALKRLQELLGNVQKLMERQWQEEIEKIILLLFPQYIAKVSQLRIATSLARVKHHIPDLILVSMSGSVDIVEIKRPDNSQLLSRKPNYRGNYIASRDLSAAVMQAEKYIADLERLGCTGESEIANRIGIGSVQIRNPKAIIIMGRTAELDNDQKKSDFEIIKRKFANVMDIVTYDDLVDRLKNVLVLLGEKTAAFRWGHD